MASPEMSAPSASLEDALNPLLEAVEASKDANIMTVRSLVLKIFSEANVFAGYDQVKAVLLPVLSKNGAEGEKLGVTLDLFSYGVYSDYVKDTSQFIPLSDSQIFKLRQLTALSIVQTFAFQKSRIVPYQEFQQALGLADGRQVEEVLISCIYSGVMGAKLCQKTNSLKLNPAKSMLTRDVPASKVSHMLEQLQSMRRVLQQSQQTLQGNQQAVSQELEQYKAFLQQAEDRKKAKGEQVPRGWDPESIGDITAAVRRQKRSRGGVSGGADNAFGRFQF
jgi:COP9 signalosome complex subunit 7